MPMPTDDQFWELLRQVQMLGGGGSGGAMAPGAAMPGMGAMPPPASGMGADQMGGGMGMPPVPMNRPPMIPQVNLPQPPVADWMAPMMQPDGMMDMPAPLFGDPNRDMMTAPGMGMPATMEGGMNTGVDPMPWVGGPAGRMGGGPNAGRWESLRQTPLYAPGTPGPSTNFRPGELPQGYIARPWIGDGGRPMDSQANPADMVPRRRKTNEFARLNPDDYRSGRMGGRSMVFQEPRQLPSLWSIISDWFS